MEVFEGCQNFEFDDGSAAVHQSFQHPMNSIDFEEWLGEHLHQRKSNGVEEGCSKEEVRGGSSFFCDDESPATKSQTKGCWSNQLFGEGEAALFKLLRCYVVTTAYDDI